MRGFRPLEAPRRALRLATGTVAAFLAACSGDGNAPSSAGPTQSDTSPLPSGVRLSSSSPVFDANCGRNEAGTLYVGAEVEPHLAINPARPSNLIASWQQDRWSNGASRGVVVAASQDGGGTWTTRTPPFSRCAGGDFERASDPWISIGPTGIAYQMVLSVTGSVFGAGSSSAMLGSRSTDGGLNWSAPQTLIQDTAPYFNDKNSLAADPFDERFVYAAWDRLEQNNGGPAYFARSSDAGVSWEAARAVHDPGRTAQIIGAELVVVPGGDLLYFFTQFDGLGGQVQTSVNFIRSRNRGDTWDPPFTLGRSLPVGTRDPETAAVVRDGASLMHVATGGGLIAATWQDGRFSNGARDGVAFSMSRDLGRTWTAPVQINGATSAGAFTPQVQISMDGLISVGYFDLRANTPDPSTLLANYWMTRSTDGITWTEVPIAGPFNLSSAANAGGLFVGDYVGLVAAGPSALSLLSLATNDPNNRSDIFFKVSSLLRSASGASPRSYRAPSAPERISADLARASSENAIRELGEKLTIRPPGRVRR